MTQSASFPRVIANRYHLHQFIGAGGMGAVYRGTDEQSGQSVAVKLLKPEIIAVEPVVLERFTREAEALRQLNHPNIVQVLHTGQDGDYHFIVMEYVASGSLDELLKSTHQGGERLAISRVLTIAIELADALTRALPQNHSP